MLRRHGLKRAVAVTGHRQAHAAVKTSGFWLRAKKVLSQYHIGPPVAIEVRDHNSKYWRYLGDCGKRNELELAGAIVK